MKKVIIANSIIPLLTIVLQILEDVKINDERILGVEYRLWFFNYGFFFIVAQLGILLASLFIWKKKQYRIVAISLFLIWVFILFNMSKGEVVFD
jgi:hypothetical protein